MKRRAFTLIELLIVVAIIAILAAIAVPNFLEAQTRSRVSRTMNDLRAISLAMETYRVDNNSYPACDYDSPLGIVDSYHIMDPRLLTTPISYIAVVPFDIFRTLAGKTALDPLDRMNYKIYTVAYLSTGTDVWSTSAYPHTAWMTWSHGPDQISNTSGYRSEPYVLRNEGSNPPAIGTVDGLGVTPINTGTGLIANGMRYDATNGTVSWGDIYRFDGEAKTRYN